MWVVGGAARSVLLGIIGRVLVMGASALISSESDPGSSNVVKISEDSRHK